MTIPKFNSTIYIIVLVIITFMPGCNRSTRSFFHEGVSAELARYRARQIYDVAYDLFFSIPENKEEPLTGKAIISFKPLKAQHGLIIDFAPGDDYIHSVLVNGQPKQYRAMNGHIYLDAGLLVPRQLNTIEIDFTATDQALNRSDEFMYTLFVPDRASTAFPCFDQPDIKAPFSLTLEIPAAWNALSNAPETSTSESVGRKNIKFESPKPIPTYLFAFTAGRFEIAKETRNGRSIRIFHRETDIAKVARNIPSIFDQHFHSLQWLENYTDIPYPYDKFDMAVLPGFQYSGMEHPGAVWYSDTRLLIDENAPLATVMRKATLIAHETAHMWFGNLVTMKWFDDVWLKEVFAGFMADKMIEELFPDENHMLQFILNHYPRAMAVDRSQGTHPIKQELTNMKLAGTLYGAIIYNKAPIVFQQLEKIMTPEHFRSAVREYLATFAHGNATWDDLAAIFDQHTQHNIGQWSQAWVYGSGIPKINHQIQDKTVILEQENKHGNKNFPAQWLGLSIPGSNRNRQNKEIWLEKSPFTITVDSLYDGALILNGAGIGYGIFGWNDKEIRYINQNLLCTDDDVLRAMVYMNLWENFLDGQIQSLFFQQQLTHAINCETHPLLINYLLSNLRTWAFSFPEYAASKALQAEIEELLWTRLLSAPANITETWFETWISLARTDISTSRMADIYKGNLNVGHLALSDNLHTQLAFEYSVRKKDDSSLITAELQRIKNPDRLRRLQFILPAVSGDEQLRQEFFRSLQNPANRRPEPWVLDALYFLHHPAHPSQGKDLIKKSLEMTLEIQQTGDIFFPLNWLQATLQNYNDPEVARWVRDYLNNHPELPANLRLKVLQAADMIFRSTGKDK